MSARFAALLALAFLTSGLAGCLGGDDAAAPAAVNPAGADGPAAAALADANATPLRFDVEPVRETVQVNGSFQPHEACFPAGCAASYVGAASPAHTYDISDKVPLEVPTHIRVELTHATTAFMGYAEAFLRTPGAQWYRGSFDSTYEGDTHTTVLEAELARFTQEPVEVVVWAGNPDAKPTMDYTLTVEITAHPERLVPGAPVEAPLAGAGHGFTVAGWDNATDPPTVLVYGPDDVLLDRFEAPGATGEYELPEGAPAGDYVLVPTAPAEGARITIPPPPDAAAAPADAFAPQEAEPTARLLELEVTMGEARDAPAGEAVEWSFDVARAPLAVGLYLTGGSAAPLSYRGGASGEVLSPAGTVLTVDSTAVTIYGSGFLLQWMSGLAAPQLVAGQYDASFTMHESANVRVGEAVVHYAR